MATRSDDGDGHVRRDVGRGFEGGDADPWYGPGYDDGRMRRTRLHDPDRPWDDAPPPRLGGTEHLAWARHDRETHRGRGPKGYRRADDRILEDVCERMTEHGALDASEITVAVRDAEVYLEGTVGTRRDKRLAEHLCDEVSGVRDVHNRLRIEGR